MYPFLTIFQVVINSKEEWVFLVGIQVFLIAAFIFMVGYLCRLLKKKDPDKSTKKECILAWFMSAIAWFIIAQIVWVITYTQITGV